MPETISVLNDATRPVTVPAEEEAWIQNAGGKWNTPWLLLMILAQLAQSGEVLGDLLDAGGGGDVTQNNAMVPASTTQTIPAGAKEWTWGVLTGTATVNGAAGIPAGAADTSTKTLAVAFDVVTDADSTAYVRWAT